MQIAVLAASPFGGRGAQRDLAATGVPRRRESSIGALGFRGPDGARPPPREPSASSPSEAAAWLERNAVDSLPQGALEQKLALGRPLRVKLGIDPTAPDIHLGHTVVLQKLREFQDLGHEVVLIIGDYTARVGDPSGRSATRPALSGAEIDANARTFTEQAFTVLDPDRTTVRFNGEWLDMSMEQLFKLARIPTVGQLLERDDFAKRFASHTPISLLELLYPLLQAYDLGCDPVPTSARRHRSVIPTCRWGATSSAPTTYPSRRSSPYRSSPEPMACSGCRSRSATTSASPSRPRRSTARR